MKYIFEPEFELGDRVYHKLPETPMGIVTGIGYTVTTGNITYYVTFDPQQGEVQCFGWELSTEKTIV